MEMNDKQTRAKHTLEFKQVAARQVKEGQLLGERPYGKPVGAAEDGHAFVANDLPRTSRNGRRSWTGSPSATTRGYIRNGAASARWSSR